MGFWTWLTNLFRRNKNTKPAAAPQGGPSNGVDLQPQCAALTGSATPCQRSARTGSKYCSTHRGYRQPTVQEAASATNTTNTDALGTAPIARSNGTSGATVRPQCSAITASGGQCSRSARQSSKYCGIHKGYRQPTATVAARAKDTKPKAARSRDTAPSGRREHVSHNGYKLYQKGNRYYFSKKSQAEARNDGAEPVYQMPADRQVSQTPNGLPVLKKA